MTSAEIRETFLSFFKSKQHRIVPSAPIVVKDDPTLMFTNAGMNQFKDLFLGNKPIEYPRIADTQKCLRVSGKHNDLEEVGIDTYHHTMFEMLGNWSFGDYFKKEAIEWAWELLVDVYKMDKSRMYVTVFRGDKDENLEPDDEARKYWSQFIAEDRILEGSKKDNFWEMGATGPCGPCTEIHVDIRSEEDRKKIDGKSLVNASHPQVIEIWNLVFIQFNRQADGNLVPLPKKHVDTGMGFERLCVVLQGKQSNYDTDVFMPLIMEIEKIIKEDGHLGVIQYNYGNSKADVAMRVIADHIRAVTFTITDGQLPSNTGAGYVVRRILRRAVRYGYSYLGLTSPFLFKLIPVLERQFNGVFEGIKTQKDFIERVIKEEEVTFLNTLEVGIKKFNEAYLSLYTKDLTDFFIENGYDARFTPDSSTVKHLELPKEEINIKLWGQVNQQDNNVTGIVSVIEKVHNRGSYPLDSSFPEKLQKEIGKLNFKTNFSLHSKLDGKTAFELYDTFGFPIDLTRLMASEKGIEVDEEGFEKELQEQKKRSRKDAAVSQEDWVYVTKELDEKFVGYDETEAEVHINRYRKIKNKEGEQYQLVFDKTPFYAEGGGQVGDTGYISNNGDKVRILDTKKENNLIIHYADKLPAELTAGFKAQVDDQKRLLTSYNHSATHLLHEALRKVLGTHVQQKGSLVNEHYLRFDFSHFAKLTDEELARIEDIVNEKIRANYPLEESRAVPIAEAKQLGAMALFGEKYGDFVRVIKFGSSIELCGGIHVRATGTIGLFKIVSETAIAAGIRRIEAITGPTALKYVNDKIAQLEQVTALARNPKDVVKGVQSLLEENHELKKEVERFTLQQASQLKDTLKQQVEKIGSINYIAKIVVLTSVDAIKSLAYQLKGEIPNLFLVLGSELDGKAQLTVMIDEQLAKEKNLNAGILIRDWAKEIEGGGGGQPFYATAGGKKPAGLKGALDRAGEFVKGL